MGLKANGTNILIKEEPKEKHCNKCGFLKKKEEFRKNYDNSKYFYTCIICSNEAANRRHNKKVENKITEEMINTVLELQNKKI